MTTAQVEVPRYVLVRGVTPGPAPGFVQVVWWLGGPDDRPGPENEPRTTIVAAPFTGMPEVGDVLEHWPDRGDGDKPGPLSAGQVHAAARNPALVAQASEALPPRLVLQGPALLAIEPGDTVVVQKAKAPIHPQLPFPHALEELRLYVMAKQTEKRDGWRRQVSGFHVDRLVVHAAKAAAVGSIDASDEDDLLHAALRALMALEQRALERRQPDRGL